MPVSVEARTAVRCVVQEVAEDECVDLSASMERAAAYPTVSQRVGGAVTPYNACPLCDGVVALLVASEERVRA